MESSASPRPVIGFAHRGARAHAPENTIEAFATAIRMGATAVETDVWLSRDGVAVIDHDGKVGPFGRSRPLSSVDAADLPAHLPTLTALTELLSPSTDVSIDVKDPGAAAEIIAVRGRAGTEALRHTWLCDPDVDRLASWRTLDADVRLVASVRRRALAAVDLADLSRRGIEVVNLPHRNWDAALVGACHDAGLLAFAWGVQRPARMRTLIGWGVDGLYSDHVDRLVTVLGERSGSQPADAAERPDDHEGPTDHAGLGNRPETPTVE